MRERKKRNPELACFCPYPGTRERLFHLGFSCSFATPDEPLELILDAILELNPGVIPDKIDAENNATGEKLTLRRFKKTPYKLPSFN